MEVQIVKEEHHVETQISVSRELMDLEKVLRRILSNVALSGDKDAEREPPVDIYEEGDKVTIIFDLPGLRKEQIKLRVGVNYVEVGADPIALVTTGKPTILERLSNFKLRRRIELPFNIRLDEVKAYYKDGVLQVHLTKMPGYNTTEVAIE